MPNTKPVGVAYSDPELVSGTTITGAAISGGTVTGSTIDSTAKVASNIASGFSVTQQGATVATTSNSDTYVIAPFAGTLTAARFSGVDALAANDTNYITFSATNLGTTGSGTTVLLAATDANTTKATGGTALAANTKRTLTLRLASTALTYAIRASSYCTRAGWASIKLTETSPRMTW